MVEPEFEREERLRMVREQIASRNIRDERVLDAMRTVPRQYFVPFEYRYRAYGDGPLPIGEGQTISQPYVVALMTQLLTLKGHERVLEIGTGSGYQAAILGRLAKEVFSIERHESLALKAREALALSGADNIRVLIGDGSKGLPEFAPFDAILLTAAAPKIPAVLGDQLADNGRLVGPVGGARGQTLQMVQKKEGRFVRRKLVPVAFVPLRGEFGWSDDEWAVDSE
jgi:protein-L-isoaspartate(D-aspartate) O-methyltransferase